MKEALRNYVCTELLGNGTGTEIDDEENLLLSGLVDSMGMMRLVLYIEENFSVAVPPEDVTIENFSTISSIAKYLETNKS